MKAVLDSTVFLNWHTAYEKQSETKAHLNIQYNIAISLDMLTGRGQYVSPMTQAQIGLHACFQQVSDLAFKALKSCTPRDPTAYFHNLIQQPGKMFFNFLVQWQWRNRSILAQPGKQSLSN